MCKNIGIVLQYDNITEEHQAMVMWLCPLKHGYKKENT